MVELCLPEGWSRNAGSRQCRMPGKHFGGTESTPHRRPVPCEPQMKTWLVSECDHLLPHRNVYWLQLLSPVTLKRKRWQGGPKTQTNMVTVSPRSRQICMTELFQYNELDYAKTYPMQVIPKVVEEKKNNRLNKWELGHIHCPQEPSQDLLSPTVSY